MFYSNNIVTPIHIYIHAYTQTVGTKFVWKVSITRSRFCLWLFWQFGMTVISFVTEAATHTTTYRRKSSEKVSAWMVFICYFSAFFSWWWQAQLHIWSRSVYEKSVFVFFIEDLKCKCALSLTATDSLSFILFPVSVLRCIMWAVRFCDLILELKLYCLQNIFTIVTHRRIDSDAAMHNLFLKSAC